jgi:hypothetical protein
MKVEEIPATVPGAKRIRMLYGPYKLNAANVGPKFLSLDLY